MQRIMTFGEFLNERLIQDEIPQLQILIRGNIGLTSKEEDFTKELMETLYDKYIHLVTIDENGEYNKEDRIPRNRRYNKIKKNVPLLNFTSTKSEMSGEMEAKIYNRLEEI